MINKKRDIKPIVSEQNPKKCCGDCKNNGNCNDLNKTLTNTIKINKP
jgi:hypothetical protein